MPPDREKRLQTLYKSLKSLTDGQIGWLEKVAAEFPKPKDFHTVTDSDIITDCVLQDFGDALRIHHCFSREAFSKDKFEYALERVLKLCRISAVLARRGNPGYDITIAGIPFSLKTEAAAKISKNILHISKFMELGKGPWLPEPETFIGLREQFLRHLNSYEGILILRRLRSTHTYTWHYELVEIPKTLLLEAKNGELRIMHNSKQELKPAYYDINDTNGFRKFQLYFDAGGERKLQIKGLKKALCTVHAEWLFETSISETDPSLTLL